MISSFLLCLAPLASSAQDANFHASEAAASTHVITASQDDPKQEYKDKKKAAGKDPEKLWEVYLWCEAYGLEKEGRSCLRAIVKADPDHREAHLKLGHLEYNGQWFTTQKKLDKFKAAEELRIAEEEGLVKWNDEWVKLEDLPYLERGMVRDDDGKWVSKEELEKIQGGWVKQDTTWVSPEEMPNMEKGLWKCGNEWLSIEKANEYHSKLGQMWTIPGDYFVLYTTCDREVAMKIMDHMNRAQRDAARILGGSPAELPHVAMLRSQEQYGKFAAGSETNPITEVLGLSSIHYAYFGEVWFDPENGDYHAAGVGYWDASTDAGNSFGPHSARHAAALSLIEAADPSPKSLKNLRKKGDSYIERFIGDFYKEKKMPNWFRYGAASYVDRYFIDQFVASGGNPNWAREWSVQNLVGKGGLRPIKEVFSGELSANSPDDSAKLLNERGLVLAFILDGKCQPVTNALGAVKAAVRAGEGQKKAFKDLEVAVLKNEKALRAFAGL